ncbi:hypothetical protein [Mycolicibacter icosiumassiliensis]|uniref:hypothetical protein n=1 Tax=Mycolicibacter icosiumassiliensis TaxID=1792835 RepID=UPI000A759409|nr:hypothetical protein [Mycolicibacter icosiumassiliensis]
MAARKRVLPGALVALVVVAAVGWAWWQQAGWGPLAALAPADVERRAVGSWL